MAEEERTQGQRNQTRRELAPRSHVWSHFTSFRDGHGKKKARCKRCSQVLTASHGTSSLKKHANICGCIAHEEEEAAAAATAAMGMWLKAPPPRPDGKQKEASIHLARMIALRGFDPSLLDDDCFRGFVASLSPEFRVPSRVDMEEMCDVIFDEAREDVLFRLRQAPGRVSVAVGTVRAIEREVLYTSCHFIDDEWNLHKVIMDAYVDGSPLELYGALLGVQRVPIVPIFGYESSDTIDRVMFGLSSYDVLDNLFFTIWETKGHRVNQLELRNQIERNKSNASPPKRTELISTTYMDSVIDSIAALLALDPSMDDDITSDLECLDLMTRKKRQNILSQLGLDNLWAYDEHWYLNYCSLEVLRNEGRSPKTGSVFTELICTLWGGMYRSIQRISAFSSPTSNLCLLELFNLREVLQWGLAQARGDNANAYKLSNGFLYRDEGKDVVDVLGEAMDDLDGSIKDSYLVWSIPLILDPRYKLTYIEFVFKRAFADSEAESYISEVTKQIRDVYADYIEFGAATNIANSDAVAVMAASSSADPLAEAWAKHCNLRDGRSRTTTDVDSYLQAEKELDRYLQDFLVPPTQSFDILQWWKKNSWNYPTVARMARDALAMPTSSKLSSDQIAHVKSILRGYSN